MVIMTSIILLIQSHGRDVIPEFKTRINSYNNVVVKKIEPDGLRISHETGFAKVNFDDLTNEQRNYYGLTKEKRDEYVRMKYELMIAQTNANQKKSDSKQSNNLNLERKEDILPETKKINDHKSGEQLHDRIVGSIWVHHYKGGNFEFAFGRNGYIELHRNWTGTRWQAINNRQIIFTGVTGAQMTFNFNKNYTKFTNVDWDGVTSTTGSRSRRMLP
jgi:hypothetical protein